MTKRSWKKEKKITRNDSIVLIEFLRSKNVKILSKEIYEYNTFVSSRQRIEICQRKNSKISWNEATEQTCVTFRSNNYVSHNINDIYSSSSCSKMMEMV